MPTYEYECPRCPRVFEVRQRITEPALETCDRCGGPVHRLLSAAPFILKGEGWYVTDYPSEARKKAKGSESASKDGGTKESSTKDGGSAEAKPAASSESKSSTESSTSSASSTTKTAKPTKTDKSSTSSGSSS